jgi:replicative DNA helicase
LNNYYNNEHELKLLGSIKFDNNVFDSICFDEKYFYNSVNKKIYNIMSKLINGGKEVNELSLYEEIKNSKCGIDIEYLQKVESFTDANVKYYEKKIKENYIKRKLKKISIKLIEKLDDLSIGADSVLEYIEKEITEISNIEKRDIIKVNEKLIDIINEIEEAYNKKSYLLGIPSSYKSLDKLLCGFVNSDLIILAARPSIGKTAFAINLINNIAFRNYKVGFFSLEMSFNSIMHRMLAIASKLNTYYIRTGQMRENDFINMTIACNKYYDTNIFIDDTPNIKLSEIKNKMRQMKRKGVEIIFIDYLTLITYTNKNMNRPERIGQISKDLKEMARRLNIPVIILSQLNRDSEGREPTLANIRQSGELEEDADVVLFLHRKRDEEETKLIIAKQRNGAIGTINFDFNQQTNVFKEAYNV